MKNIIREFLREVGGPIAVVLVVLVFRTTAFGMYHIPSESMLPTLSVGDRISVNKYAYGYSRYSLPFSVGPDLNTPSGRILFELPERGDVVVFKHPHTNHAMIKRLIGLPGDVIEVRDGRLLINNTPTSRAAIDKYTYKEFKGHRATVQRYRETLVSGKSHSILERSDFYPGDNVGPLIVPEHHLFFMGDNRDNSLDSRYNAPAIGIVHTKYLVGRAERSLFSITFHDGDDGDRHGGGLFTPLASN